MSSRRRELVDLQWRKLEQEPPSDEGALRVADLPVETLNGRPAVAVDREGYRHLLMPVMSRQEVRKGLNGPVLVLRKRVLDDDVVYQHYADLGCLSSDVDDLFTTLCGDVLDAVDEMPDSPLKALYRILDRWRSLFRTSGSPLGTDQQAGLFSELLVLARLLELDSNAHRVWKGPSGHQHDFAAGRAAVEVKTSTGGQGRRIRIHGLNQLAAPGDGTLQLAWFRLEGGAAGDEDLIELVRRVLRLCDDETTLLKLLSDSGYHPSDDAHYRDIRYAVVEERWYAVDEGFPKLTGNQLADPNVANTVLDISYTIDLSGEPPYPVERSDVSGALRSLIQEPA